ncbi:MAG: threonine synthase, partial [Bacilli bacterium]|nr:threonine synthase [Bacilli bacterium]
MFYSTRDSKLRVSASVAILKGLSGDKGLFLPVTMPKIDVKELLNLSYPELATYILSLYLDDFTQEEIKSCVEKAYCKANFADEIIGIHKEDKFSVLELFHGPTVTFKDMALSLLPHLMNVAKKKNNV